MALIATFHFPHSPSSFASEGGLDSAVKVKDRMGVLDFASAFVGHPQVTSGTSPKCAFGITSFWVAIFTVFPIACPELWNLE